VSKNDKLIQRVFSYKPDITPDEAIRILKKSGYVATPTNGSHLTFRKPNCLSITIILTQNPVKPYLIEKLQDILKKEGY